MLKIVLTIQMHFSNTKGGEDVPVVVPPLPAYYPPPTCEGTTDSTGCNAYSDCEWIDDENRCQSREGFGQISVIGCERYNPFPFDSTGCNNDPSCEWLEQEYRCRPKGGYRPYPNPVTGYFPVTIPCGGRHPTNPEGCDNDQGCQWLEQEYRCAARDGNPFVPGSTTGYPKYPGGPNPPSQEEIYCNSISIVNEGDLSKCYSDDRCGLILNPFPNPLINNGRSLCTAALGCGAYLYAPLGTGIPSCTNDPRCTMSYWPYGCFGA